MRRNEKDIGASPLRPVISFCGCFFRRRAAQTLKLKLAVPITHVRHRIDRRGGEDFI